jgi:hypothetical protein
LVKEVIAESANQDVKKNMTVKTEKKIKII